MVAKRNAVPDNTLRGDYKSPQTMRNFTQFMNISERTELTIADMAYNGPNLSNSIDLIMGGIAFTGWGAPIAGTYFIANLGWQIFTGETIGETIQNQFKSNLTDVKITKI